MDDVLIEVVNFLQIERFYSIAYTFAFDQYKNILQFISFKLVEKIFFLILLIFSETGVAFVSRGDWGAIVPSEPYTKLDILPAPMVLIGHTGTDICLTQRYCSQVVQSIQKYQMSRKKFIDIGYQFLIGGDGAIYEGRGWDVDGAHTPGYNNQSICLGFIGDYNKNKPTDKQLEDVQKLLDYAVRHNKLTLDYKLFGQCQLFATDSPGEKLYDKITKLKHWSSDSKIYCDFL